MAAVDTQLRRLGDEGLGAFPPRDLDGLARACAATADSGGGLRYFSLSQTIGILSEAWQQHEAFWTESTRQLNEILAVDLPQVLCEPIEEAAVSLAAAMRDAVVLVILNAPEM